MMDKKSSHVTFPYKIYDALHDLPPFVQFKNVKNTHEEVLLLVLKVKLLYGCFSRFLNCPNGTKIAQRILMK